jgi:hypothetical protein
MRGHRRPHRQFKGATVVVPLHSEQAELVGEMVNNVCDVYDFIVLSSSALKCPF